MESINKDLYKVFDSKLALKWGKEYYGEWLLEMQNQKNSPQTPTEKFFRGYTQGIHYMFNRVLRNDCDIDTYCEDSTLEPEMFYGAINEIMEHPVPDGIVVYRYLNKYLYEEMHDWCGQRYWKKGDIIFDKAFLSTTLTPETVRERDYVSNAKKILKIYVPKGTPCVYVELLAKMKENEVLFAPKTKLKILSAPLFSRLIECIVE